MTDESLLDQAFAAPEPQTNLGAGNRLVPGELLSGLRHDMRTPIHQILGYAEMLEEDAIASGQTGWAEDLGKIQAAAKRLLGMVDGLPDRLLPEPGETTLEGPGGQPAAAPAPVPPTGTPVETDRRSSPETAAT